MLMNMLPSVPIPEPITSLKPGTWAHSTIVERLPVIGRRVVEENLLPPEVAERVKGLIADIPAAPLRLLSDPGAPEVADWNAWLGAAKGQNWLQAPRILAEAYFYRRLVEATGYFQAGPLPSMDPFEYQKRRAVERTLPDASALADRMAELSRPGQWDPNTLAQLLQSDLWGNRADLSLWPADGPQAGGQEGYAQAEDFLLVSDLEAVQTTLEALPAMEARLDFIADNAGFELVVDLLLADYLLLSGRASQVRFHLKIHPTFVSDALIKDVHHSLAALSKKGAPALAAIGRRLADYVRSGRLQLVTHPYWTSPLSGWQMPADLYKELSESALVIVKGDANYRRLLGDRQWPFTTPFEDIVSYFPAPLLALRTLKAELAAGLSQEQIEWLNERDAAWLTDGQWGVIQYVRPGGR